MNPPRASHSRKGRTMKPPVSRAPLALLTAGCAVALAACGGGGKSGGGFASGLPTKDQQRGGALEVLSSESFQNLDPGGSYSQIDYEVVFGTQRPLYSFKPD